MLPTGPVGFSIAGRRRSIGFALTGLWLMVRTQHNAWLHTAATVLVAIAGILLHLTAPQWCLILLAVSGVWVTETMNTAFEFLCDVVEPAFHPAVQRAKDVAAGAVLVMAFGAAIVGGIVFVPHVLALGIFSGFHAVAIHAHS